jgi:hypothetical protein
MKLWNVDSKDSQGCGSNCVKSALRSEIQTSIDQQGPPINLTILFHDRIGATASNLESYMKTIEDAVQHKGRNI